jgi:hypothetical protein
LAALLWLMAIKLAKSKSGNITLPLGFFIPIRKIESKNVFGLDYRGNMGSQPKSSTGPPGRVWVLKQPVVAPFVCSISSGVNTRAPLRLNTRFDMTCSFQYRKAYIMKDLRALQIFS